MLATRLFFWWESVVGPMLNLVRVQAVTGAVPGLRAVSGSTAGLVSVEGSQARLTEIEGQ